MRQHSRHWQVLLLLFAAAGVVYLMRHGTAAESVDVRYFGRVDLSSYDCLHVTRSSFIRRVCFNRVQRRMVISLNGICYAYCAIPESTVSTLTAAGSMGQFYNSQIKGRYACNR